MLSENEMVRAQELGVVVERRDGGWAYGSGDVRALVRLAEENGVQRVCLTTEGETEGLIS